VKPERFGRYEVLAEIGDGAMGRVYSAWDPVVTRKVAIKTIKTERLPKGQAEEFLERFRREAQAAGGLNHPNIVNIFDIGDDHIVMEYIEGQNLQDRIREEGRLSPEALSALLGPIAEALDHAHAAGIIHRDIKPANIMIQADGQPRLTDFGVARIADSAMTATGEILGSPTYMSPEQVAGLEVTSRADVYSLAVVAYEALTGQPPFKGKTITAVISRVMHDEPPPPRRWNADLPTRYDNVFARALAKDPAERFGSAVELVSALDIRALELALDDLVPVDEQYPDAGLVRASSGNARGGAVPGSRPGTGSEAPTAAFTPLPTAPETGGSPPLPPPPADTETTPAEGPRIAGQPWLWALVGGLIATTVLGAAAVIAVVLYLMRPGGEPEATGTPVAVSSLTPVVELEEPAPARSATARARPTASKGAAPKPRATPSPVVSEGQLVPMGPGVTPPRRVTGTPAPYPALARRVQLTGTVTVSMIVSEHGEPLDPTIEESGGDVLDQAVLDAVKGWHFEPARKDGVKVRVRWTVRQKFTFSR
jgi:serine/threonine-protein kinase